jgi:hypothetical protein
MNSFNDSPRENLPTRRQAIAFFLKSRAFCVRRWICERRGKRPRALPQRPVAGDPTIAESRTPLYGAARREEWALQAGKVHNLRLAARALHGRVVTAGEVFSFWMNVGRAVRRRGFVEGRELREGCIVPSVGGGLCQLSNALYDVALQAGAEIIERHPHSRRVPGSAAIAGRDATVFWNYVDLRFRAVVETQLAVELTSDELRVRLLAPGATAASRPALRPTNDSEPAPAESCETCGATACFRHSSALALPRGRGVAWIVDAFQPEHDEWMREQRGPQDSLLLPLDSLRFGIGPYRWTSRDFAHVRHAPWTTLRRSLISRRLSTQGATRQRTLLQMDEAMACSLAKRLPPLATHLVISQNLLPFLWRAGILGGRTFDVMMTRLPLQELEATLDRASRAHPESATLADFRASSELIDAETAALARARCWITPHSRIAALAGSRACLLEWHIPQSRAAQRGDILVFPASTLGRKGAYELRAVARDLHQAIRLVGPVIESRDFWEGVDVVPAGEDWLDGAAAVVLPAWIEHQPRRLLQAVAADIPVIASDACGLDNVRGVINVPCGDIEALRTAICEVTNRPVNASDALEFG